MKPKEKLMEGVKSVVGKDLSIRIVQNAEDVRTLAQRAIHLPEIIDVIQGEVGNKSFQAWIWGKKSFGIARITDDPLYGRILNLIYALSEPGFFTKKIFAPELEKWGREMGAKKMLTIVHEERAWTRITGWKPWGLVLAKEL